MRGYVPNVRSEVEKGENQINEDLYSFLINNSYIPVSGFIDANYAENLINLLAFARFKKTKHLTIALNSVNCVDYRFIFSIYEQIKSLRSAGVAITIEINGVVEALATLLAVFKSKNTLMLDTAVLLLNEMRVDSLFVNPTKGSSGHLQASDLKNHVDYYVNCERKYFELFHEETGIPLDEIHEMHDRMSEFDVVRAKSLKLIKGE